MKQLFQNHGEFRAPQSTFYSRCPALSYGNLIETEWKLARFDNS